jgi:hypothetical protein
VTNKRRRRRRVVTVCAVVAFELRQEQPAGFDSLHQQLGVVCRRHIVVPTVSQCFSVFVLLVLLLSSSSYIVQPGFIRKYKTSILLRESSKQ